MLAGAQVADTGHRPALEYMSGAGLVINYNKSRWRAATIFAGAEGRPAPALSYLRRTPTNPKQQGDRVKGRDLPDIPA